MFTWGEGANCRLGQGYDENSNETPNAYTPGPVEKVFENAYVMSAGCGKKMSGIVV